MSTYLMLVFDNETDRDSSTEAERAEVMQMHGEFAKAVAEAGATPLGGEALQSTSCACWCAAATRS